MGGYGQRGSVSLSRRTTAAGEGRRTCEQTQHGYVPAAARQPRLLRLVQLIDAEGADLQRRGWGEGSSRGRAGGATSERRRRAARTCGGSEAAGLQPGARSRPPAMRPNASDCAAGVRSRERASRHSDWGGEGLGARPAPSQTRTCSSSEACSGATTMCVEWVNFGARTLKWLLGRCCWRLPTAG